MIQFLLLISLRGSIADAASPAVSKTQQIDLWLDASHPTAWSARVEPEYISYTLDWWAPEDGDDAWPIGTSIISADLSSSRFRTLARGLSPAFMRLGGSKADKAHYYGFPTETKLSTSAQHKLDVFCRRQPHRCLTTGRWREILEFARDVGGRIVFTLNYLGRTTEEGKPINSKCDMSDWDGSNARALLQYTASWQQEQPPHQPNILYGVELGNEVTHNDKVTDLKRYRKAYMELKTMLEEIWSDDSDRPLLMGAASTGTKTLQPLAEVLGSLLDVFTYHKYHASGDNPRLASEVSQPKFHSYPPKYSTPAKITKKYLGGKNPALWIGEGAMAYNSGQPNVTDTWLSSLWYANLLGTMPNTTPLPHSVYCRQSLLGGHYALLQHNTKGYLKANPDYWIAYLWSHLVGEAAIGPLKSSSSKTQWHPRDDAFNRQISWSCCSSHPLHTSVTLRAHSFCAKPNGHHTKSGDVVVILIQFGNRTVDIDWSNADHTVRSDFVLRAADTSHPLISKGVLLNNVLLGVETNDKDLPDLSKHAVRRRKGGPLLRVEPYSVNMIILHGANEKHCIDLYRDSKSSSLIRRGLLPSIIQNEKLPPRSGVWWWSTWFQSLLQLVGILVLWKMFRNKKRCSMQSECIGGSGTIIVGGGGGGNNSQKRA